MAKTRLSTATYVERGYGQVEPNHLSAQRTAQIYAQLPAASTIAAIPVIVIPPRIYISIISQNKIR